MIHVHPEISVLRDSDDLPYSARNYFASNIFVKSAISMQGAKMLRHFILISTFSFLLASCSFNEKHNHSGGLHSSVIPIPKSDSLVTSLDHNISFLRDSLLMEKSGVIANYFSIYQPDTCGIVTYRNSELKEAFEGQRILKSVRTIKLKDTVFVIPSFNYCDNGESYCFFDKTIPRLKTDSYCCHPEDLFVLSDIDEDQINEIGIFYSTCAGRYKSLRIYSLKQNAWTEIGSSVFDVQTKDPTDVKFEKLVRKIGRGRFQICNYNEGRTYWETITMK